MNRSFSLEHGGCFSARTSELDHDFCLVSIPAKCVGLTMDEVDRAIDCLVEFRAEFVGRQPPRRSDYEDLESF